MTKVSKNERRGTHIRNCRLKKETFGTRVDEQGITEDEHASRSSRGEGGEVSRKFHNIE